MDLSNTQCLYCKHSALTSQIEPLDNEQIYVDAIICKHCGSSYDYIWGLPYLGVFKQQEILSILEIAANAAQYQGGKNSINGYLNIINMVDEYTLSSNKAAVPAKYGLTSIPYWLEHRYSEHVFFKALTQAINLESKHVLDIGAGSGYDSLKFHCAGASVTCLEFNPALGAIGKAGSQHLRWFGGSSDNLPFADCQFDVVAANAALHHLANIPQSLQESLRVLKPGGYLITLGDSFMADSSTEEQEAHIFNHHTSVLQGINEQIPKFHLFVETFKQYREALDIRVFTQHLQGAIPYHHEWSFEDAIAKFPQLMGNIHFLVQKKQPVSAPAICTAPTAIRPSEYAKNLYSPDSGVDRLIDLIPDQFVNLAVMDQSQPKFRLLNGWKLKQPGENQRTAYKRARLFFSLDQLNKFLYLSLLIPYISDYDSPRINIKLNSVDIFSQELARGVWHQLHIPVSIEIKTHKNFLIEIQLQSPNSTDVAQEFLVRELMFLPEAAQPNSIELEQFGLETLMLTVLRDENPITVLVSPNFEHSMDVINRMRVMGKALQLIIPQGQEGFYAWIPGCTIVETYPNFILAPESAQNYKIQHSMQLISASELESIAALQSMSQHLKPGYIIHAAGKGQLNLIEQANSISQPDKALVQNISTPEATLSLSLKQDKLIRLKNRNKRLQIKVKHLQEKVFHLQTQLQEAKTEISAIKTSKLWKMKRAWIQIKKRIKRLP